MQEWITPKNLIALAVVAGLSVLAILAAPGPDTEGDPGPWYSILPPLLAVTIAIVTGKIMVSLLLSVFVGGLLNTIPAAPFNPVAWFEGIYNGGYFIWASVMHEENRDNPLILAFVTLVLAMVATIIVAGGLHGIVLWLSRFAKGPRSAQVVTYLMGLAIFIDDYANTMIVGSSMRALTDRYQVSREKLSFLVDATSAPIAGLAVISTWVGYEVGLFSDAAQDLGIDATGYSMLFDAILFRYYCVMMLIFVAINVWSRKDFGPMKRAEERARDHGLVADEDAEPMTSKAYSTSEPHRDVTPLARTGVIPIVAMFLFLLGGIWVDGNGMDRLRENPFALVSLTTWRDVISASENSIMLLAVAAAFGLMVAVVSSFVFARAQWRAVVHAVGSGARSSALPIIILVLAWSLKEACDSLNTGPFLVAAMGDSVSPAWFPAITFIVAGLTAFSTGTSYGTMAILMPTAVPIAYNLEGGAYGLITMITLAAILDGSIFGDHCSPISDTTIMSSISSSADHMHHVRTQLPYALTVASLALVFGYMPAGLGGPWWLGFVLATMAIAGLFFLLPVVRPKPAEAPSL